MNFSQLQALARRHRLFCFIEAYLPHNSEQIVYIVQITYTSSGFKEIIGVGFSQENAITQAYDNLLSKNSSGVL